MNFQFSEKEEQLRKEIRAFVKENLPPGHMDYMLFDEHYDEAWRFSMSISRKLAQKGWLTMSWPKENGGMGASQWEKAVFLEETGYWGIPGTMMGISGTGWVGPSLILFGTEYQKKKFLPPIAAGDDEGIWCTGYSEPDAGSDFANLQTRAEKRKDVYVVNGQKVWTSLAHRARWCWLAVRTNPDVQKKHHGISVLLVDMQSPGITVRPLPNLVGLHSFNEVFFDEVEVPALHLVGEENMGWYVLMQALAFERGTVVANLGSMVRLLEEMVCYARQSGCYERSDMRQKLADLAIDLEAMKMCSLEENWKLYQKIAVVSEPARNKALYDRILEKISRLGTEIILSYSQVDPLDKNTKWSRIKGAAEHVYWGLPGMWNATGTTDTQKNIISQFRLQLPKSY